MTLEYNRNFQLPNDTLYRQYIFRVPSINAHNIRLNFRNSILLSPYVAQPAQVSMIDSTDKYVEIRYVFWNDYLVSQTILDDKNKIPFRLKPDVNYIFLNDFTVEYDAVKWDWILQAVVAAILLTITFYLGTLWQRKRISTERIKAPK